MFDLLLLLSEGRTMYFGPASYAVRSRSRQPTLPALTQPWLDGVPHPFMWQSSAALCNASVIATMSCGENYVCDQTKAEWLF